MNSFIMKAFIGSTFRYKKKPEERCGLSGFLYKDGLVSSILAQY
ncbi:MAG: hypothetical protein V4561_11205 [Bacteroidota bacterium]